MRKLVIRILKTFFGVGSLRKIYSLFANCVLKDNQIRHFEPSIIYSKEDSSSTPELISIVADGAKLASQTILKCGENNLEDSKYLNIFPGEHYRFLNGIVQAINAKKIVEIGTWTGLGSLALKEGMNDILVTTFDILEWDKLPLPSHFKRSDFDESLIQVIGDLSDENVFEKNFHVLNEADLIFMDAPKDDEFEYKMAKQFKKLNNKDKKILIIDDILFVNMIDFWRKIKSPKIDASAFGHFSGTGIVDISNGFLYD